MSRSTLAAFVGAAIIAVVAGAGINLNASGSGQGPARAQDEADVRKRIAALEAGQQAILKELREIKSLLQQRPAVPPLPPGAPPPGSAPPVQVNQAAVAAQAAVPNFDLDLAGSPSLGKPDAKVVLLEFSDFECPFCGRYSRETFDQIEKEFVTSGKIRYVFRHFPIEKLHPHALRAHEASECARSQGKFWEMHHRLFANQQALAEPLLIQTAQGLGLDMSTFQSCMATQLTSPLKIRQDLNDGGRAGITGTPTFFLGTVTKDGKLKVIKRLVGAAPFPSFKAQIDALLAAPATGK
jgi:protein-disulfide isomerase